MTFLNYLTLFLVGILAAVTVLSLILRHLETQKWMRISCERSGIPSTIMDSKPKEEVVKLPKIDKRNKISIPIPGADAFRKPQ